MSDTKYEGRGTTVKKYEVGRTKFERYEVDRAACLAKAGSYGMLVEGYK